jgi:hypothetical protein
MLCPENHHACYVNMYLFTNREVQEGISETEQETSLWAEVRKQGGT